MWTWLAAVSAPLVWRVLGALGIGIVVYEGVDQAVTGGLNYAKASWQGFGGEAASLVALTGINTALGIIAGAIGARVGLMILKRYMVK